MPDKTLRLGSLPDNAFGLHPQALSGREPNPQDLSFTYMLCYEVKRIVILLTHKYYRH